jgi:hypothetical protein
MQAIKVQTISDANGRVILENIPVPQGTPLEVIILVSEPHFTATPEDPLLALLGQGKLGVDPDEYLRELRKDWI